MPHYYFKNRAKGEYNEATNKIRFELIVDTTSTSDFFIKVVAKGGSYAYSNKIEYNIKSFNIIWYINTI